MKFGENEEYEARRLVPDFILFFKKALYEVKACALQLSFNIFRLPSTWHTIKTNYIKLQITDLEICSILTFQKRVYESPTYIVHDISRKIFLMLYFIN